jgi:protein TonB
MTRETLASLGAALAVHVLALFGLRPGTAAKPLPIDTSVEVDLVAAAPAAAVAEVEPPKPEPEPMPVPEPPKPEMPELPPASPEPLPPEPIPTPAEKSPATPAPKPRPAQRPKPAPSAAINQAPAVRGEPATVAGAATTARPRYRSNPQPIYPAEARRLRQQGQVLLTVEVSAQGRALSVALKQSSGFPSLDQSAIQTVGRWSFEPARIGGMPVTSRAEVPVRFRLKE